MSRTIELSPKAVTSSGAGAPISMYSRIADARPDDRDEGREAGLQDVTHPAVRRLVFVERGAPMAQPRAVFTQIVDEETSLALERDEASQPRQLAGVEPPVGDGDLEADDVAAGRGRLERDLVDRETELV
jgi:hypothetical protein